jgi:hypothetical protein
LRWWPLGRTEETRKVGKSREGRPLFIHRRRSRRGIKEGLWVGVVASWED